MLTRLVVGVVVSAACAAALERPAAFVSSGPGYLRQRQQCGSRMSCLTQASLGKVQLGSPNTRPLGFASKFLSKAHGLSITRPRKMGLTMQVDPGQDVSAEVDEMTYSTAVRNTAIAVSAALAFGAGIGATLGLPKALEFFTGYIVEESLSVDNLFVFILLFQYFKVPPSNQQKVLKWGIIGAALLRGFFISAGLVVIQSFKAVLLVFAGFLIFSSFKILTAGDDDDDDEDLSENPAVRLANKLVKSTTSYDGDKFFTIIDGVKRATPLLLVLVCVELSDIMFAVDSIPAVFGVTEDPLIVLSSNLFAVLGLRALFQIVSNVMKNLQYLEQAVGLVLGFVGLKMVGGFAGLEVPPAESLAVIMSLLGGGVGLSFLNKPAAEDEDSDAADGAAPAADKTPAAAADVKDK